MDGDLYALRYGTPTTTTSCGRLDLSRYWWQCLVLDAIPKTPRTSDLHGNHCIVGLPFYNATTYDVLLGAAYPTSASELRMSEYLEASKLEPWYIGHPCTEWGSKHSTRWSPCMCSPMQHMGLSFIFSDGKEMEQPWWKRWTTMCCIGQHHGA